MKKYLVMLAAASLAGASFAAWSIESLNSGDTSQLRPAGTVQASGARDLDDLQDKLALKKRVNKVLKAMWLTLPAAITPCLVLPPSTNSSLPV